MDLMGMLRTAIGLLPWVFICINAGDKLLPKCLPELLESLRDNIRESPATGIFLTESPHVREDIQKYFTRAVVLPISPNTDDIRNYPELRSDRDPELEGMSDDSWANIVRAILENISNIYMKLFRIPALLMIYLTNS